MMPSIFGCLICEKQCPALYPTTCFSWPVEPLVWDSRIRMELRAHEQIYQQECSFFRLILKSRVLYACFSSLLFPTKSEVLVPWPTLSSGEQLSFGTLQTHP